ncbi:MAG: biotin/lipoyl-binding protein, partial [Rhodospirillales bacterium]|nr:biotin/lipoyl-binding protein [Rhodospirillales bacterium]
MPWCEKRAASSGAVIAPGTIVVEGSLKKVQHPQGGVVGAILVKTGDRVQAGDLLLRLDETQTRANLAIVRSQLTELSGVEKRNHRLHGGKWTSDIVRDHAHDFLTHLAYLAHLFVGPTRSSPRLGGSAP